MSTKRAQSFSLDYYVEGGYIVGKEGFKLKPKHLPVKTCYIPAGKSVVFCDGIIIEAADHDRVFLANRIPGMYEEVTPDQLEAGNTLEDNNKKQPKKEKDEEEEKEKEGADGDDDDDSSDDDEENYICPIVSLIFDDASWIPEGDKVVQKFSKKDAKRTGLKEVVKKMPKLYSQKAFVMDHLSIALVDTLPESDWTFVVGYHPLLNAMPKEMVEGSMKAHPMIFGVLGRAGDPKTREIMKRRTGALAQAEYMRLVQTSTQALITKKGIEKLSEKQRKTQLKMRLKKKLQGTGEKSLTSKDVDELVFDANEVVPLPLTAGGKKKKKKGEDEENEDDDNIYSILQLMEPDGIRSWVDDIMKSFLGDPQKGLEGVQEALTSQSEADKLITPDITLDQYKENMRKQKQQEEEKEKANSSSKNNSSSLKQRGVSKKDVSEGESAVEMLLADKMKQRSDDAQEQLVSGVNQYYKELMDEEDGDSKTLSDEKKQLLLEKAEELLRANDSRFEEDAVKIYEDERNAQQQQLLEVDDYGNEELDSSSDDEEEEEEEPKEKEKEEEDYGRI